LVPYFELRALELPGGVRIAVFGALVALGVATGVLFAERRARAVGVPERELHAAILWAVIPGFALSHLVALLPHAGRGGVWSPGSIFAFWNGMSSFGGFAGAFFGLAFHFRRRRTSWLPVAEVLLQALVVGWVFGRLGCALVHDHVGRPSESWLAVRFPGGPRHDLGLYELLYTALVLLPAVALLNRRPRPPGATICAIALLYAPARFLGDFLRQADLAGADPRLFGLTFAQYGCIALAGVGLHFARRIRAGRATRGATSSAR
jgi:phosphatidylglycerol:prolipoprotein diacylglycerol transferase